MSYTTREAWLDAAVVELKVLIEDRGFSLPANVRVSCGWPIKGASRQKNQRIGEAFSPKCSANGSHETFISPVLADALGERGVLATLLHELVHHAVGCKEGHKGAFKRCALAVGLRGKMTSTEASPELLARLNGVAETLGAYPHAALSASDGDQKKQTTRLLKVVCASCGYTARITNVWLEQGAPTCPCGTEMTKESVG